MADVSFGAMNWGTGKPPTMKVREPSLRSKVRERKKVGENTVSRDYTISHGGRSPGSQRKRSLPFLEYI